LRLQFPKIFSDKIASNVSHANGGLAKITNWAETKYFLDIYR